jgi:peptidyl-tRNA hydrolase, PTH1 family
VPWFRRHDEETNDPELRLVVGLGNPGAKYERTRHNVGFMVTEALVRRHGGSFKGSKQRAEIARIKVKDIPVLVAQPITYMNDSGHAVRRLVDYYRVPVSRLLLVCDDIDLPFATLRLRPSGSSGGHGGLKSIVRELGTEDFVRLRVGVGRPARSAVPHVLGEFGPEEMKMLPALVEKAADAVTLVLVDGVARAMNEFNRDWSGEL